jgi:hypothetical protein
MAAQAAPRNQPGHPALRALGAAALFTAVAVLGLSVFPGAVVLVLFLAGPAGSALLFSGPPPTRNVFTANGIVACLASGAIGALWIVTHGEGAAAPAVAAGAVVSFVLLSTFGALVCYAVSLRVPRGE